MRPKVSVICPLRNMEGRLQNLQTWIESCNSQFQIIFVCDTCTDKTSDQLRNIKNSLPLTEIEIIEGIYGSPGIARNAGLARAVNDWVVFWDSDDIGAPIELVEALSHGVTTQVDALVFGFEIHDSKSQKRSWSSWPLKDEERMELLALNPGIWRICFKRSSINNLKFPGIRMAEDQVFINNFIAKIPNIEFRNDVIYKYFVNVSNQLTSNKEAINDLKFAAEILSSQLGHHSESERFTLRIYGRILLTQIKQSQMQSKLHAGIQIIKLLVKFPKETFRLFINIMLEKPK